MDSNHLNEDRIMVINHPRIIFVKEYKSDSDNQDTSVSTTSSELQDERILVSPLNLADNISFKSYPNSISISDDEPIVTNQNSLISKKIVEMVDRNSFRLVCVVSLCVLSFLSLTLIPYHNVILCRSYWFRHEQS